LIRWNFADLCISVVAIFAFFGAVQAQCGGRICAVDLRSGGPQNFNIICAMRAENNRSGSEFMSWHFDRIFNCSFVQNTSSDTTDGAKAVQLEGCIETFTVKLLKNISFD
jgi:hypothetical protein